MNEILSDLLDITVIVYLDDILIFSVNPANHEKHVKEVLRRLTANGLYCSPGKCEFSRDSVEFLGFICTTDGVKMDKSKVQTIHDGPHPHNVCEVQSFLSFANFYRHFIRNYSNIVIPLTRLTRKTNRWDWTTPCQNAFDALKEAFTTAPVLVHWQPDCPLIIETDASDYAIAGILSIHTSGDVYPIAFHSHTLSLAELNYDTHDKELLAIFEAFQIWRHYLEGAPKVIDVITDHKNLEYFATTKMLNRQQA
jgi:hypothetical protein